MSRDLQGRTFIDRDGKAWQICSRKRTDMPMMAAEVDTGELVPFSTDSVAAWAELRLSAAVRLLGDLT